MRLGRVFRQILFWGIPIVACVLLVITGFIYWLVGTNTGSRWAMNTAALQFEGQSRGVEGSLWHGLGFEALSLQLPNELRLEVEGVYLKVDWMQLWHSRRLVVNELSARRVAVWMDGETKAEEPDSPPFVMPHLPVSVQVDKLALGQLYFSQQGQELPVDLSQLALQANGSLNNQGAQVQLQSVRVGYDNMWLEADAKAQLLQLAAPWDSQLQLSARAFSNESQSQLCLDQYLPSHLQFDGAVLSDPEAPLCALNANINWKGSLDQAVVTLVAAGQGLDLDAQAQLQLSQSFPLRDTTVQLALADGSGVNAQLNWQRDEHDPTLDRLEGSLDVRQFNVGAWLPQMDLPAKLTLSGDYAAQLSQSATQLEQAQVNVQIKETSRWNGQNVAGHIVTELQRLGEISAETALWNAYAIKNSDIDIRVGANHVQLKGAFGLAEHRLDLLADAPAIAQLWPGLEPIGATKVEAELTGSLFEHQLKAQLHHVLSSENKEAKVGNGPIKASLALDGVWDQSAENPSWRGRLQSLQAEHAGLGLDIDQAVNVGVLFPTESHGLSVDVGAFALTTQIDAKPWVRLFHENTQLDDQGVSTKGKSDTVALSVQQINQLVQRFGLEKASEKRGGVIDKREQQLSVEDLSLVLDWDVTLKDALAGTVRLQRFAGDILVPAEPAFPLGLKHSEVVVTVVPQSGGRSVVQLEADIQTEKMGYIKATGSSPIYYHKDTGIQLRDADVKELVIDAHMDSLAWTSLILQDQLELGGELIAQVNVKSTPQGGFDTQGAITGNHLKITRLDDGVRLLDGELQANITNNRFTIDRLYFPALLRVEPKEWRTATWISENEDAKNGSLLLNGYWDLEQNTGNFDVKLHRYPILQRADRYAMVSGDLHMEALLPQINLSGKITADAGWFNLDMLGGIPTIDGDIMVIRSTDPVKTEAEDAVPMNMKMDLEVDLGPRFYLTGYGVNSGLIGQMRIHMDDGQLTALGALNTRGGAIEMYGQRLQLRRGTITFQGDITSPILDIQALRTGLSVEAGVKVGGTARKPKIDLISTPEVSELEKLSWLLFGHGPDESGGDLALLLSVGTSFLSDGEPFYRRFGIDELSMRSGELGGAGSILPATSTASSRENEMSEIERRFIEASKTLSSDITVSVRQALADTGTVGRVSYRLSRRLNAELSIGTVSGLALIYRWFSRD